MSYPDETVLGDGFEILTKLSSGGMGDVLLARRRSVHGFEKLLAIKTIRGELAKRQDIRAMFNDEARLSARLDHPAIAQVYDYGEDDGSLFLAMEYVPGIALNKLIMKQGGPLPPPVAARIIADVCRGLHAAHELRDIDGTSLGVVHRDVSPGNLILTFDGHVKILDFGIAFMNNRESPDTVVGELKGKPSYMAPEHLRGQAVDRRADIYSVAVVLHELLTGRKLFTRDTVVATVLAVETSPVHAPSSVAAHVPRELDAIVLKGLERRPQNRFSDARAMAAALDRLTATLGGDSLETFVERELASDREYHRAWLQSVLSGTEPIDKTRPGVGPFTPAGRRYSTQRDTPPPRSSQSRMQAPAALEAEPQPGSESRPLADPTTLVPGAGDQSQPQAVRAGRSRKRAWMWAALVGLSFLGLFVGYRAAFDSAEAPPRVPARNTVALPGADPLSPQRGQVGSTSAETAKAAAEVATSTVDHRAAALDAAARVEAVPRIDTAPRDQVPAVRASSDVEPRKKERDKPHPIAKARPQPSSSDRRGTDATSHDTRAKAATTFGFVTIGAQPYALVRIDGQEVGATPIIRRQLGTGTHEIMLVGPDTGEVRLKRTVTLAEGEHQRIMLP